MARYSKLFVALLVGFVGAGGCSSREDSPTPSEVAAVATLGIDASGIRADQLGVAAWGDNVGFNCWFTVTNTGTESTT